jgi:hypothetical protein
MVRRERAPREAIRRPAGGRIRANAAAGRDQRFSDVAIAMGEK